jgi:N-acetylglucosaminyldiphosphoundecaprenol N-acetyl-beta-D-mannosaminyltransferase
MNYLAKNSILGVTVTNETREKILDFIIDHIEKKDKKIVIFTPNPEMIVLAQHSDEFKNMLNSANIALCDGVGLSLAGTLLGKPFKERITGIDFMQDLCEKISDRPITASFLGAGPKIAELASERLKRRYPGLKIGFFGDYDPDLTAVSAIKEASKKLGKPIDVLFVAYGYPKQEQFVSKYLNDLPVHVVMVVGGSFDYLSGRVSRAPQIVQKLGLEWLYRLVRQPWRIKRQFALLIFIYLILKERITNLF